MTIAIEVKTGEGKVAKSSVIIKSNSLGSCVAIILYDLRNKIGGLAHVMLPKLETEQNGKPFLSADLAVSALLEKLESFGANKNYIIAKAVGGANMFSGENSYNLGFRIMETLKNTLQKNHIPLIADDVGGYHGRNVEFYLDTGKVIVTAIKRPTKVL